jgi:hypothetical protein
VRTGRGAGEGVAGEDMVGGPVTGQRAILGGPPPRGPACSRKPFAPQGAGMGSSPVLRIVGAAAGDCR